MPIVSRPLRKSTTLYTYHHHLCSKKGQVHKFLNTGAKAPTDDRRDDLRFQLRAKISQKDYVDKQMKAFHYNQEMISSKNGGSSILQQQAVMGSSNNAAAAVVMMGNAGEDKLEQLKK